ncbi:MAG TPA: hypothetical protein VJ020_13050 [Anaerolineales bacterium]|nr:hypothetical protein [Anaerolineales bacterium]
MLKYLLPIATLVALLLAQPSPAWACSCVLPDPPPIAFANTDAVFVGRVTQINDPSWPGIMASGADPVRVVFQVNDSWKGVATTTVMVETAVSGASCGYVFDTGKRYVVYAYNDSGVWNTNMCTRTNYVTNAAADLAYLNTLPKLTLTATSSPISAVVYVIGAVVILAAVIGGIWLARYARKQRREVE